MGHSLSKSLGLSDPLDNSIHNYLKPGPQQANYQAPAWWGPVQPQGLPRAPGGAVAGLQSMVAPSAAAPLPAAALAQGLKAQNPMTSGGMGPPRPL